jgi:hypothetical protein
LIAEIKGEIILLKSMIGLASQNFTWGAKDWATENANSLLMTVPIWVKNKNCVNLGKGFEHESSTANRNNV